MDSDQSVPRKDAGTPAWKIPPYAILSHTWGPGEVLFADVGHGAVHMLEGFRKIRCAADQAQRDGFQYLWIDTCCIDKSSSAELSEAINSMYAWYRKAERCYAYLEDVATGVDTALPHGEFARSKWFTRGWCLQELLAPTDVVFYSSQWHPIGTKTSLRDSISKITRIDADILSGARALESASVAKRMSWAAFRQTTREEDLAYCLMGLFSVNMPMLYGEGSKAFHRLQQEIMKQSDDQSIFAWVDPDATADDYHGLLADSPAAFARSGHTYGYDDERAPFEMTTRGLRIDFPLTQCDGNLYAAALNCLDLSSHTEGFLAIFLKRLASDNHQFARVKCQTVGTLHKRGSRKTVFVRQQPHIPDVETVYTPNYFELRRLDTFAEYNMPEVQYFRMLPNQKYVWSHARSLGPESVRRTFKVRKGAGRLSGALLFRRKADEAAFLLLLGSITDSRVGFNAMELSGTEFTGRGGIEERFNPQPASTPLLLDSHRVRVDVLPSITADTKVYALDIYVKSVEESPGAKKLMEPVPTKTWRKFGRNLGLHRA